MRTARAWGARPSEFLSEWSARDREMAIALDIHESRQTGYGLPESMIYDDDGGTYIGVRSRTNYAEAALHHYRKQQAGDPEPGEELYLVDERLTD